MLFLDIIKDLNKAVEPFKNWIFDNYENPALWLGLFFGIIALFWVTVEILKKEK